RATKNTYVALLDNTNPFNNASSSNGRGNTTLDDATNDLIADIERGSPHLRAVNGSGQRVRMGGGTALAATLRGQNPNTGVMERVTVVTRQLANEHLLYMLFITPDRDAANYNGVLNEMVNSMQVATNAAH